MARRFFLPPLVFLLALAAAAPGARADAPPPAAPAASAADRAALQAAFGPRTRLTWPEGAPRPTALHRLDEAAAGTTAVERAQDFLARRAALLRLEGVALEPAAPERSARGVVVRLQQHVDGVPVYQRGATVVFDAAGERIRSLRLSVAAVDLPAGAWLPAEEAIAAARAQVRAAVVADGRPGTARRILAGPPARRVWQVVFPTLAPVAGRVSVFVDATTGALVWQRRDTVQ